MISQAISRHAHSARWIGIVVAALGVSLLNESGLSQGIGQGGREGQGQGQGQARQQGRGQGRPSKDQGTLKAGAEAPDFTLSDVDGKNPITLSKLRGKPTVLVFGSCTCPPFVASTKAIEKLFKEYSDRVNFVTVYQREAHPTDGRQIPGNQFQVASPKTMAERCEIAKAFDEKIEVSMPLVVDTIDDATGKLYSPWPNRMYIIDAVGVIIDAGEAGAQGTTKSAKAAPAVLDRLLGTPRG